MFLGCMLYYLSQCSRPVHKRLRGSLHIEWLSSGGRASENCLPSPLDSDDPSNSVEILSSQHRRVSAGRVPSPNAWWNPEVPPGCCHSEHVNTTVWCRRWQRYVLIWYDC